MNATTRNPVERAPGQVQRVYDRPADASRSTVKPLSLTTIWTILRFTFGLVPIVAGLDKFTNFLVNWESYINPLVLKLVPLDSHAFMGVVGVIEIVAGILTLVRPRLGGFIVTAWLTGIALSLLASGRYFDIALRDLVMAIGAFTFANLTPIVTQTNSERSL